MDPVQEIKSRLPIEDLVGGYCQLKKKGRGFVALCPFHSDSHPSLTVSPDKGIAYCFACQTGGDIFSFYQAIERVDFPQAIKDLAERTGVKIHEETRKPKVTKDEKQRLTECLDAAKDFFAEQLHASPSTMEYLRKRGIPEEQIHAFHLGFAPDSFSDTYEHLLKKGFSRSEIVAAGLGVLKDLKENRIYDRFRNRLMFPISDAQGNTVAFGGRTLNDDDAKYINSAEGLLYNKSAVLFNFARAKEALRTEKAAVLVEGYFDVLACDRVGCRNVVAVSGTALTELHVKTLKRACDTVVLCLDQDRAGKDAAERAFILLAQAGIAVTSVRLPEKDPDEVAVKDPELLRRLLVDRGTPYLDVVIAEIAAGDTESSTGKRAALSRLLPLLKALPSAVEREHYVRAAAGALGTTATALEEDLARAPAEPAHPVAPSSASDSGKRSGFSSSEIALGLFFLYPNERELLKELIEPTEEFANKLYRSLLGAQGDVSPENLALEPQEKERAAILILFCEEHGFGDWSQSLAEREIRKNCKRVNREILLHKQMEIARKLKEAKLTGKIAEEAVLATQYQQVLKLTQMAS